MGILLVRFLLVLLLYAVISNLFFSFDHLTNLLGFSVSFIIYGLFEFYLELKSSPKIEIPEESQSPKTETPKRQKKVKTLPKKDGANVTIEVEDLLSKEEKESFSRNNPRYFEEKKRKEQELEIFKEKALKKAKEERDKVIQERMSISNARNRLKISVQNIGISEKAKIINEVLSDFFTTQVDQIFRFLDGEKEIRDACKELNFDLKKDYERVFLNKVGKEYSASNYSDIREKAVSDLMEMGLRAILKHYLPKSTKKKNDEASREIKSSETWEDIKKRL